MRSSALFKDQASSSSKASARKREKNRPTCLAEKRKRVGFLQPEVLEHAKLLLLSNSLGGGGEHEREDDAFDVVFVAAPRPSLFFSATAATTMESSQFRTASSFSAAARRAKGIQRSGS